jgi:chemotaxis protein CheC
MTDIEHNRITDEEIEILQEIMNIAFGKATADLAEFIDIFIKLSVPDVNISKTDDISQYIGEALRNHEHISVVEQKFWGKFKGYALLIFPAGSGKELITILAGEEFDAYGSDPIDELEKATLMEVGNILIGACIGKIADILNDIMTYSPPIVLLEKHAGTIIPHKLLDPKDNVIILKTIFNFETREVSGLLLLLFSQESIYWLKKALNEFMEQYE